MDLKFLNPLLAIDSTLGYLVEVWNRAHVVKKAHVFFIVCAFHTWLLRASQKTVYSATLFAEFSTNLPKFSAVANLQHAFTMLPRAESHKYIVPLILVAGSIFVCRYFGPVTGLILGFFCLRYYEDPWSKLWHLCDFYVKMYSNSQQ
ncbi:hypothetical protein HPB48_022289 [Haemaphysalis longicornis]|uniref:Uncharacterized protein n=1 Tax=Haemaphysalis longicornis TaxID=44386 RepID=A0A9J6FZ53_HAELO|nr:hypothetical protein HPB48_022289 [Haemaphysalis longicornis]